MFALSSCIGATIKTAEASELRLITLNTQINNAMRVFNAKAGRKVYFGTAKIVEKIWIKLQSKHDTTIHNEKLSVFVEMLCMLVPPNNFKDFIGIAPCRSKVSVTKEEYAEMAKLALDLDFELNNVFGTSPYALTKPKQKLEKVKKQRDKKEPKDVKPKQPSKNKLKRAKKRKEIRLTIKEMVAKAKAKRDGVP